eukprot:885597-Pelagomonas_calceolata.AAC.1
MLTFKWSPCLACLLVSSQPPRVDRIDKSSHESKSMTARKGRSNPKAIRVRSSVTAFQGLQGVGLQPENLADRLL